jgi:O-antigen/teichoic acid export membrane protein
MIRRQLQRLAQQSLVYGIGGIISRLVAIFLLPVYTSFLGTGKYGVVAFLLSIEAAMVIVLRAGVQNAFFRFYYLSDDLIKRRTVIRTSFWFTMTSATVGMVLGLVFAPEIVTILHLKASQTGLVRATAVFLWGDMNYEQQASIFRVEQRSVSYAIASVSNVAITILATVLLVVVVQLGSLGLIVGNFTGTLCVYVVLLVYRAKLLGFEFDRKLYRAMEHFGLPLLPSALALWTTRFSDRLFIKHFLGLGATGVYSFGVQIASGLILIITAFQLAWPAFAYSIQDDTQARRVYSHVLTYYMYLMIWAAVGLSLLAPFLAHLLSGKAAYHPGAKVVPYIAFSSVVFAAYSVLIISIGRARRTGANWLITGFGAAADILLNIILIPRIGQVGAAVALLGSYSVMFLGMTWRAHRVFPVPYQWRRLATLLGAGVGLVVIGKALSLSTPLAFLLALAYPVVLFALGFYSQPERAQFAALLRRFGRAQPASD